MDWLQAYLPRSQIPLVPSLVEVEVESQPRHPYYPQDLPLPGYVPNNIDLQALLLKVSTLFVVSTITGFFLLSRLTTRLKASEKLTILWFILSGFLHTSFERYLITTHQAVASKQDLYAQLWKEYALSDSRYLTSDTFVICIETMTVFVWGPLCFLVALLIARRSVHRFPVQAVVCVAHLYGDVLYYATSIHDSRVDGVEHSRPEPLYYWGYFVGMNAIWIVVPAVLLWQSISRTGRAFGTLAQIEQFYIDREDKKREALTMNGAAGGKSAGSEESVS